MNFSKKNHEHNNNNLKSVSKKVILCLALVALFVATSCKTEHKKEPVKKEKETAMEVYQCPMDCEKGKTYDKEGSCPVCKMDLKKVSKNTEDHSGHNH